jgi:hypothetical protein
MYDKLDHTNFVTAVGVAVVLFQKHTGPYVSISGFDNSGDAEKFIEAFREGKLKHIGSSFDPQNLEAKIVTNQTLVLN